MGCSNADSSFNSYGLNEAIVKAMTTIKEEMEQDFINKIDEGAVTLVTNGLQSIINSMSVEPVQHKDIVKAGRYTILTKSSMDNIKFELQNIEDSYLVLKFVTLLNIFDAGAALLDALHAASHVHHPLVVEPGQPFGIAMQELINELYKDKL